ncbi:MAG: CHC2 zinc finger domain-containing protein [Flavipsychrobacter sp.]
MGENFDLNEKIVANISIIEVIGSYITLMKRGSNYIGLCPFHKERSPSFYVSESKKIFKCFGCGKGGNVITFISYKRQISNEESIKFLASQYKLPVQFSQENEQTTKNLLLGITLDNVVANFNSHIDSVLELLEFDKILMQFCISQIEELSVRIKSNKEIAVTSVYYLPDTTLQALYNIQQNESLKRNFTAIYNQGVVLLVAYFTSAVKDFFKEVIQYIVHNKAGHFKSIEYEFKIGLDELEAVGFDLRSSVADIILKKKSLSFQDMQSIIREYKLHLGIDIPKTSTIDNIILAQAARHAIVHSLAIADEKFIAQVSGAPQRTVKRSLALNEEIHFDKSEVQELISEMKSFFNSVSEQLKQSM